jgi:surface polysaccharide O-acyltransferase-like enzyme
MTMTAEISPAQLANSSATVVGRDSVIDTMRGIAILMVIGIHSLHQPLMASWEISVDAALRPCVPIFLFVSGYLSVLSGRVPLARRFKAILIPYAIAFVAAYFYMAQHNPAMDHRLMATGARFILAYVFVYYYVFVYAGCTALLWLVLRPSRDGIPPSQALLAMRLTLAMMVGLMVGSYLDPLLFNFGVSASLVEEFRLRDIPFWFGFAAFGGLVAMPGVRAALTWMRAPLAAAMLLFYVAYAAARYFQIGDSAAYDSIAFFFYAALLCSVLFAINVQSPWFATLGSGSYFIYLWHIFIVMVLRDHLAFWQFGALADAAITVTVTIAISIAALMAVRKYAPFRLAQWLGA